MSRFVIADGQNIYRSIFSDADAKVIGFPYTGFKSGKNYHWLFYRITHSKKLGYPFFQAWNRFVVRKYGVKKGDTVVVLNNAVWSYLWNGGIIDELKRKGCNVVILMVDSMCFFENDRLERMEEAISKVNQVYTFDIEDAKRFGWKYTLQYYSKNTNVTPIGEKTDIFCALWSGGRIEKLVRLYDHFDQSGIKCSFYIHGATDQEKNMYARKGIIYNHFIPYEEILGRIAQTNVILELVKNNQRGNTLRAFEAAVYNKRLLTDYHSIEKFPLYNNEYMQKFSDIEDIKKIDLSFFTSGSPVDYHYQNEFSPRKLFEEIESL